MAKPAKPRSKMKARRGKRSGTADAPKAGVAQGRQLPPRGERDSVEDPLEDWPEDDADRWVLEREADDMQRDKG